MNPPTDSQAAQLHVGNFGLRLAPRALSSATHFTPLRADREQADQAISYLQYARAIEQGGTGDTPRAVRELEKDEAAVKEAALTCLLLYFAQSPAGPVSLPPALPLSPSSAPA